MTNKARGKEKELQRWKEIQQTVPVAYWMVGKMELGMGLCRLLSTLYSTYLPSLYPSKEYSCINDVFLFSVSLMLWHWIS